jgi:signal transduction histidine kinase
VIWVESRSAVINDNQGQPIGFRGVITDVTARKRAEDSLRFLSDASQVLASSLDFEATLRSIVELTVQSFADGCALDLAEGDDTLRRVAHSQREIRAGSEAPHRFNASLEARGRSLGMMTFTRWSTDGFDGFDREIARLLARRAAVAIDNANLYRDAVEASHARDEFLATLSHELRTPMTVTLGWVRMLLRGDLDEPTRASALEAIERSTRAQSAIIDDILDVSRIVMGKLRLDVGEIDLRSVVEAAVETIQPATEAKSIRLECSTEGWNGTVRGDAARLQQVVWNLLSNAIKFGRKDGLILLRLLRAPAAAVISISDDGAGIDPKVLPHIFERFRQGESGSTRSFEGLGLGLAIVKHVVEMHGGSVRAHSEGIGQGATFTVELPLVKPAATQPAGTGADAPVLT